MKPFLIFFVISLISRLEAQSTISSENFNSGFPSGWTQMPVSSWSLSASLGTASTGCIYSEEVNSASSTATVKTQTLNINGVTNLTISFQGAIVTNNFIPPNIAVSYDAGAGPQFLARWGNGFSPNTTYTVSNNGSDYTPPLDAQNVIWFNCTHTISAISASLVSFVFDAEFVNGGYALIDDLNISGVATIATGIENHEKESQILLFPNPVNNKKLFISALNVKEVFLSDESGRILKVPHSSMNGYFEVDLRSISKGIYITTIISEDGRCIKEKIVVD